MASKKVKGRGTTFVLGCAALMVCGLLAIFDGLFIRQALQEREARGHWEQVPAIVTASKVDISRGSDSTSYTPRIHFRYLLDGRDYTGKNYSFLKGFSAGERYADRVVESYPRGAEVTAYVDPKDPSRAVLSVDGSAFPKLALIFLAPFHCVAFGLLAAAFGASRRRKAQGELSDLEYRYVHFSDQHHFVVRKRPAGPTVYFLGSLGLITFVMTFVIGLSGADHLAPLALISSVAAAAALTRSLCNKAARPENFLHVDRDGRTFAYPADAERVEFGESNVIDVDSTSTNVTINDQRIYKHDIRIGEGSDAATMFTFKGPIHEGEALREIIEGQLGRDLGRDGQMAAAA